MDSASANFLKELVWEDFLLVAAIVVIARLLILVAQWGIKHTAERAEPHARLRILRWAPKVRLIIELAAIAIILPIVVEPTFHNTVALIASVGLVLAFAFKDYGSCLVAGLVTILEGTYQPGDWIRVDGAYGEVKTVGIRAVRILTTDDDEVIIPHSRLWSSSFTNSTMGKRSLLCVANFYLDPDHDGQAVSRRLIEIAESSPFHLPDTPASATVMEKPWGTHYRLKAYATESREQNQFITDMTLRGKDTLRAMKITFARAPFAETEPAQSMG
ncbi:MAG TPA: mechanosensitive ion channel domain-containing protein [Rhizomicrobium sp.]|jgi:small-conductance mechanosensitive channel